MAIETFHTPEEAAKLLRGLVTPYWLKKKARQGLIDGTRLAGAWVFTDSQLNKLLTEGIRDAKSGQREKRKAARAASVRSSSPVAEETGNVRVLQARPERARSYKGRPA